MLCLFCVRGTRHHQLEHKPNFINFLAQCSIRPSHQHRSSFSRCRVAHHPKPLLLFNILVIMMCEKRHQVWRHYGSLAIMCCKMMVFYQMLTEVNSSFLLHLGLIDPVDPCQSHFMRLFNVRMKTDSWRKKTTQLGNKQQILNRLWSKLRYVTF